MKQKLFKARDKIKKEQPIEPEEMLTIAKLEEFYFQGSENDFNEYINRLLMDGYKLVELEKEDNLRPLFASGGVAGAGPLDFDYFYQPTEAEVRGHIKGVTMKKLMAKLQQAVQPGYKKETSDEEFMAHLQKLNIQDR